tara:strand:+ start:319 stop:513 length:195 start_codon:yes stop_codon:yes gene_type:complete
MNKKRYQENSEEGFELLWPSEKEDKITRKFYRELSYFSENKEKLKKYKKPNFFAIILLFLFGNR